MLRQIARSQSAAARAARPCGVDAVEPVEDERQVVFGDSDTGVFDDEDRRVGRRYAWR